jgi:hypothetical protein
MAGNTNAAKQWSCQQTMTKIVSFLSEHLG